MPPHNLTLTVAGTGMLWVGWFGFNAGQRARRERQRRRWRCVVTQISAAAAALTWMAIEWARSGSPSVLGIVTGSVAGLAAITPASGFVGPVGALGDRRSRRARPATSASTALKRGLGYDDSLDVFGVHGVGGFLGTRARGRLRLGPSSAG